MVQISHPYMTTGKTIALTRQTFVVKVMSLLFNMLSRLIIAFLPRIKRHLISWLQSPSAVILEPKRIKPVTVSIVSPSICYEWQLLYMKNIDNLNDIIFHQLLLFLWTYREIGCLSFSSIYGLCWIEDKVLVFMKVLSFPFASIPIQTLTLTLTLTLWCLSVQSLIGEP